MNKPNPLEINPFRDDHDEEIKHTKEDWIRRQRANDLMWILSDPRGIRFFKEMMIHCQVFEEKIDTNSMIYVNEGRRNVGFRYFKLIGEVSKEHQMEISPPYEIPPYSLQSADRQVQLHLDAKAEAAIRRRKTEDRETVV